MAHCERDDTPIRASCMPEGMRQMHHAAGASRRPEAAPGPHGPPPALEAPSEAPRGRREAVRPCPGGRATTEALLPVVIAVVTRKLLQRLPLYTMLPVTITTTTPRARGTDRLQGGVAWTPHSKSEAPSSPPCRVARKP